jgi:hypothetical protein
MRHRPQPRWTAGRGETQTHHQIEPPTRKSAKLVALPTSAAARLGASGLVIVTLTHICEALQLFPVMGWGLEGSPGASRSSPAALTSGSSISSREAVDRRTCTSRRSTTAVISNAVYDAIGARLRQIPFRSEREGGDDPTPSGFCFCIMRNNISRVVSTAARVMAPACAASPRFSALKTFSRWLSTENPFGHDSASR